MKIAILVPVLNEVENINQFISQFTQIFSNAAQEYSHKENRDISLIFIDDGSDDGTQNVIYNWSKTSHIDIHLIERGKQLVRGNNRGSALLHGIKYALESLEADLVIEMDGDLSHRPAEVEQHIQFHLSARASVLISSKYSQGSETIDRSRTRVLVSWVATRFMRMIIDPSIEDWTNGYRSYRKECAEIIVRTEGLRKCPLFLTESIAIWLSHGVEIRFVRSVYIGRQSGESKIKLTDILVGVLGVLRVAYRFHLGKYKLLSRS